MMTTDKNKTVVIRFNKEVIEGKNTRLFGELFDPAFINRTVRPGFPAGPEGMLQFLNNVLWKAFSDIRVDIHEQVAENDKVTTRKTIHGTHTGEFMGIPPSHKRAAINVIDIVRLRNEKYIEHWSVIDLYSVITELSA